MLGLDKVRNLHTRPRPDENILLFSGIIVLGDAKDPYLPLHQVFKLLFDAILLRAHKPTSFAVTAVSTALFNIEFPSLVTVFTVCGVKTASAILISK